MTREIAPLKQAEDAVLVDRLGHDDRRSGENDRRSVQIDKVGRERNCMI